MKHFLRTISTDGLFLEDTFWEDGATPTFAGNPIPAGMVANPCPDGFHKPKWTGSAWVEGVAPATLAASAAAAAQTQSNAEQRAFLLSTDWLVLRHLETGKPVPPEITEKRRLSRTCVVERGAV